MLVIDCPYCGPRSELEFSYAGEAHIARPADPSALDDEAWVEFLQMRSNPKGVHAERWRHLHGCARFFNALRDTTSDVFLATYKVGDAKPEAGVRLHAGEATTRPAADAGSRSEAKSADADARHLRDNK